MKSCRKFLIIENLLMIITKNILYLNHMKKENLLRCKEKEIMENLKKKA